MADFDFPSFFEYPPYFTLQPVRDTKEKQIQLWKQLILNYCQHYNYFAINVEDFPLFVNSRIQRKLSFEAREVMLAGLVADGRAEWLDKAHRKCLIHWKSVEDWADAIVQFARDNGLEDGVMTVDEIQSGEDTRGTKLAGIDRVVLIRALKLLEQRGKAVMFKGKAGDDEGIKFSI